MQKGCKHKTKQYMCDDCNHVTDSIECYEYRDKHRTNQDITDGTNPEPLTDEKINEVWDYLTQLNINGLPAGRPGQENGD